VKVVSPSGSVELKVPMVVPIGMFSWMVLLERAISVGGQEEVLTTPSVAVNGISKASGQFTNMLLAASISIGELSFGTIA